MRAGFFGSFANRDEGHEARRAIHAIRRNLDHETDYAEASRRAAANSSSAKQTRYLCVVKIGGTSSEMQEQFFPAESTVHAVLLGLRWARLLPAKTSIAIDEMRIMNLNITSSDRTTNGMTIYSWRREGNATLETEFERVTFGLLQSQVDKLTIALDEFLAKLLDSKCDEIEKLLGRIEE